MRHAVVLGLAVFLGAVLPAPSHGQWVEAPGTGWVQLQVAHQSTKEGFGQTGTVVPLDELDPSARSIITTARLTGALGLVRGLDTWVDLPLHRQEFNGAGTDLLSTGLGDPRFFLRAGPSLFGVGSLPVAVALRGGVTLTTGTFENDAETISLSQGQRDWSVLLEVGKSLHPWPMYVSGWAGYRWREENEAIARDPGNEWVFNAAAGGSLDRFEWKIAVDGLFGQSALDTRTGFAFAPRELVQITPTVGWRLGPGALQAGVRIPVHGQSTRSNRLPASSTFTLGYFLSWDDPLWK
ncbi:transporter [Salinibacter altiplanensis]|uniref:transporter n=1 Tax=Salinibacter altiplanensis TaxID=1803181 RepID=UPI000C9FE240|nr:transporter [Salinibacter altiplanensis]